MAQFLLVFQLDNKQHLNIDMVFFVQNLVRVFLRSFDLANDRQNFVSNNLKCTIHEELNTEMRYQSYGNVYSVKPEYNQFQNLVDVLLLGRIHNLSCILPEKK